MRPTISTIYILLIMAMMPAFFCTAQEQTGPLMWNQALQNTHVPATRKTEAKKTTTSLSLPFFEDFNYYSPYADSNKWTDFTTFINNTMGVSPVSWGVATFDDLDAHGFPYDSFSNTGARYCDSLTSLPIDISADSIGDSIYLSFVYQAQGNGYYPLPEDSLIVFFKNKYGDFNKVWSIPGPALGTSVQPFQTVMIPILDTFDISSIFQFRFVNMASLNWSDAVWNVDYIKLDKGRNMNDTTINDVGFTANPTFLLNDYTSMPYNQFKASPSAEFVSQVGDSIRNDTSLAQTVNYGFTLKDGTFNLAGSPGTTSTFLPGYTTGGISDAISPFGYPAHAPNSTVTYQTKFFLDSTANTGPTGNDTILHNQVFDNYLAYDDGSAERSYYLNLFSSTPGYIEIEYHLNQPDTLRGMEIYFGRQIPFAGYKPFYITVYSALAGINGAPYDNLLTMTTQQNPAYMDSTNKFFVYLLDTPLALPAGTFYAGTMQTDDDGSDSLYYGLDVNRIGGNHAYYSVLGSWSPSLIAGAIMMRPVIGRAVSGSAVHNVQPATTTWQVLPNPATNTLKFQFASNLQASYRLSDVQGNILMHGNVFTGKSIDISALPPGMYFVTMVGDRLNAAPQKMVKL